MKTPALRNAGGERPGAGVGIDGSDSPGRSGSLMKRRRAKKLCGADAEMANFIVGLSATGTGTGFEASRALLREFRGIAAGSRPVSSPPGPPEGAASSPPGTAPSPLGPPEGKFEGAAGGTGFAGNGRQPHSAPVEDLQEWGRKF